MPVFEDLRDASPGSIRKLNDMLRWLYKKVQGGITRDELSPELTMDIDTVDADKLVDDAITGDKIGDGAIDGGHIQEASITNAHISDLDAEKIIAGDIATERMSANVIDAVNISTGDISADRIQAGIIDAFNANINHADIAGAYIKGLSADNITAGNMAADRIKANVVEAINAHVKDAVIDSAYIGDLAASKITSGSIATAQLKANVIDAVNFSTDTAVIDSARISDLTAKQITSGTLDTGSVKVGDASGTLVIAGNTITINAITEDEKIVQRVALGDINGDGSQYGMEVGDNAGSIVLKTDSKGHLWLKSHLTAGGTQPEESLAGISGEGDGDDVRFWAGIGYNDRGAAPFYVTQDGRLFVADADITGTVTAHCLTVEEGSVTGELDVGQPESGIVIDGAGNGSIYSQNGSWSINGEGVANFNNANIRGTLNASVFNYEEVSATAGSMMVMNAAALKNDLVVLPGSDSVKATINATEMVTKNMFHAGDMLAVQFVHDNIRSLYWFSVISTQDDLLLQPVGIDQPVTIPMGSVVLNFGHEPQSTGIRLVGASAVESAPFIDMNQYSRVLRTQLANDVTANATVMTFIQPDFLPAPNGSFTVGDTASSETVKYQIDGSGEVTLTRGEIPRAWAAGTIVTLGSHITATVTGAYDMSSGPKLRLGNLSDIKDMSFTDMNGNVIEPAGYGLYAENVFLKGSMQAVNCNITNSTLTGNLYTGTLDTDNIVIADRRIEGSEFPNDWKFIVHPDLSMELSPQSKADKSKYRLLMAEQGVFNHNYDWYWYKSDGKIGDEKSDYNSIKTADAFARVDSDNCMMLAKRIGHFFVNVNEYISGQLFNNTLRFTKSQCNPDMGISGYDLNAVPVFELGAVPAISPEKSSYNFIGCRPDMALAIGVAKKNGEVTTMDSAQNVKMGINTAEPNHELDARGSIGMSGELCFEDGGQDKVKIIKQQKSGGTWDLLFFIL